MAAPIDRSRGAQANLPHRFSTAWTEIEAEEEASASAVPTELRHVQARSILSQNQSPDVPFGLSVNPYQGCEHGCVYCFARPSHAYLDLNPGLDFETRIQVKDNAAELLRLAFSKRGYRPQPLALAPNTDAWQPAEHKLGLSREILQVCVDFKHPVVCLSKSRGILRDLDLLAELAREQLVRVMISLTSLDPALKRSLEPRAAGPQARLQTIRELRQAGVPVGVLLAPIIPAVNDHEIEQLLEAAQEAGADSAGWVLLRLPHEVAPLFRDWLQQQLPQRAEHVMSLLRDARGGQDYDARFGQRMRGSGAYASMLEQRFRVACARLGLRQREQDRESLNASAFRVPGPQQALF